MEIEKSGSKQLKSISYKALVQNPTAVIRDIYDWFGYSRDVEIEKNILNWLAENPQHKHGVHKYKLEDFGFTETDTRDRFSNYFDEYGDLL
jgi:hypothetical protein